LLKAIVFDFDGVIVDSEKIWLNVKKNTLIKCKIKINKITNFNLYSGVSSKIFFKKFIPKKTYQNNIKCVIKTYNNLLKKSFAKTPKFNKKILSILKIKNLQFCIVSNNSKNFILKCLKKHNISKYFKKKFIVALKKSEFRKPLPYGYLLILKKLNCKPSEVIVVEDSFTGIKAAKKAKIKNIFRYNKFKFKKIKSVINITDFKFFKKIIINKFLN
jgi:HAD superfamily hydrolase (TIGR01509 family)